MTSLSVLIIDDEPLARRRVLRVLAGLDGFRVAGEAGDAATAFTQIRALAPDIVLLDIQMPGASGFDLLDRLGADAPVVVFVTAFDHHALRAFDASAIDYVTKPIAPGRLAAALDRARTAALARRNDGRVAELTETVAALRSALRAQEKGASDLWVRSRGEHLRIPAERIDRIQAERDYVRIHADGESWLFGDNLAGVERRLDPADFLRVHRSAIVRRDRIVKLRTAPFAALILHLRDGSEVRVGRTYAAAIRRLIRPDG